MADKDLGALIVRIQADVTQLKTAVDSLNKVGASADTAEKKVATLGGAFSSIIKKLPGLITGFMSLRTVMKIDNKFTEQIKIQEYAIARLGSAILATKGIAGLTIDDFEKMAATLQKTSTRTRAEITNTQSILAAFTNIRGQLFEETTKTVINLADAFEMDLKQVARSIGKAMQNPTKGMLSLQRIGLGLTPVVMAQVKSFMDMNKVMEAQKVILDFLGTRLDHTSKMMAETMPGAIQLTKNAWDNLFRVGATSGVESYRLSLLKLRDEFDSDSMKQFFDTLGSGWFHVKSAITEVIVVMVKFKGTIAIAAITAMTVALTALAATIKLLVIPVFGAFLLQLGTLALTIAPFVAVLGPLVYQLHKMSQVKPISEHVADRLREYGKVVDAFDLNKLKQINMGHGMTGKSMALTMRNIPERAKAPTTVTKPAVQNPIAVIEEMQEQVEKARYQMENLMNQVKYNGKSAASAIAEINKELSTLDKWDKVDTTKLNDAWVLLNQYKETLESMSGKTMKDFSKASKEAFSSVLNNIKNQMEFLGTPGESFLPGLNSMLKQFPVLSENWVSIKKLIISIEDDISEVQIKNAQNVRAFKEAQEKELSEKIQKLIKKQQEQWSKYATFTKLGFMPDSEHLSRATEEFKRLMDIQKTDPSKYLEWSDELIEAYERVHNIVMEKVQPVMDTLNEQYENGSISLEQYQQAMKSLISQYGEFPGVTQLIVNGLEAQKTASERARLSMETYVNTATSALRDKLTSVPDEISNAFAGAIAYGEDLSETLTKLARDIVFATVKAMILKSITESMSKSAGGGGGAGGGISGIVKIITSLFGFAKGGAFGPGGVVPFAKGGIVGRPTIFPFAKGTGLMGEAGPEAIMPLKRGPDGSLGVSSSVGKGGDNVTVHMTVNALDSKSVVDMLSKNKGTIESIVVSSFKRNGALRGAIKQGA